MNRQTFEKAKSLVKKIDQLNRVIEIINEERIYIEITDREDLREPIPADLTNELQDEILKWLQANLEECEAELKNL